MAAKAVSFNLSDKLAVNSVKSGIRALKGAAE